jgi:hypothetical protein
MLAWARPEKNEKIPMKLNCGPSDVEPIAFNVFKIPAILLVDDRFPDSV